MHSDDQPGARDTPTNLRASETTIPPATPYSSGEHRALGIAALVAIVAMLWVAQPLGIGLLLGMLSAFTLQPLYRRMHRHLPPRPDVAATLSVTLAALALFGTVGLFAYLVIQRGVAASARLVTLFGPTGAARTAAVWLSERLRPFHISTSDVNARLAEYAGSLAARLTSMAGTLAGAMFDAMLTLFFVLTTLHFTLRRWDTLVHRLETMSPLHPRHTHALLEEFRVVGRTVLLGTLATGIAQGILSAFGYWATGVPEAALLGAATAIASLVPVVGTLVIWIPAAIFLFATGHVVAGIVLLGYGAFIVVGVSDYGIRPRLVGAHDGTPTLVTFVALFGGIEVFGVVGLVLGPVIMALAMSVMRIYEREVAFRRGATSEGSK